jgi:hypothetical protein
MNIVLRGGAVALFSTSIISQVAAGSLNILYNTLGYITYGKTSNADIETIKSTLNSLDLEVNIKIVNEFIMKTDKTDTELILENGLNEIITKINKQLENINSAILNHQLKWFSSYRSFNVSSNMTELKELSTILNNRLQMLILMATVSSSSNTIRIPLI